VNVRAEEPEAMLEEDEDDDDNAPYAVAYRDNVEMDDPRYEEMVERRNRRHPVRQMQTLYQFLQGLQKKRAFPYAQLVPAPAHWTFKKLMTGDSLT
jgi:hypothetical protein